MAPCRLSMLSIVGMLLLLTENSNAQIGPNIRTEPSAHNFVLHVDYETGPKSFMAILVSSGYAITSPSFLESYASGSKVYSGNFTDPAARVPHKVTKVMSNDMIAVLKLCPLVTSIDNTPAALDPSTAFAFDANVEADVLFYKRATSELLKRTENVNMDNVCSTANVSGQVASGYLAPNMTCLPYNNVANGCTHVRAADNSLSCYPILMVNNKPVGVFRDVICSAGKMDSQTTFFKIMPQLGYVKSNSDMQALQAPLHDELQEELSDEFYDDMYQEMLQELLEETADEQTEELSEDEDEESPDEELSEDMLEDEEEEEEEEEEEDLPNNFMEELPIEAPEDLPVEDVLEESSDDELDE